MSNIRNRPVGALRGRRFPAEPLTPSEMTRLLAGCSRRAPTGVRNRALILLMYRSGLRISEVLALRPADVDLERHTIRLRATKSGHAQTRGLHPSADAALLRWLAIRPAGPCLFSTLDGGPLAAEYVRIMLRRLASRAGISKRVAPHQLRHSFAVELEMAGTPVSTITKLMGHKSVATTSQYLLHLTNHQAVTALAAVELPALAC